MEPVSFAIGIASIASVFQTCIHAYRTLATAMTIGDAAVTLDIQFQVEELRLRMWGRDWGLLKDEEERSKPKGIPDDDSDSDPEDNTSDDQEWAVADKKNADFLDDIDDNFQIPGLQKVAIDVLGRISKSLEEWRSITEKYQAGAKTAGSVVDSASVGQSSREALSNISGKQAKQAKEISIRTKIIAKGRWALKDKQDLEVILAKLTRFNDGLQNLLPRRERASLNRGLAGELLKLLEDGSLLRSKSHVDKQLRHIEGTNESKAARIVGLKRLNKTETVEKTAEIEGQDVTSDTATPFAKPSIWIEGSPGSMQIPFEQFHGLPEPKITKMETHDDTGRWIKGKYVPLPRSRAVYFPAIHVPTSQGIQTDTASTATAEKPGQVTLVEWRPTAHESRASELTEQDLKDRRDHIARLLSRTATTDTEFRVLNCLGYTAAAGHTEDGSTHDLVGYVYEYPEFASPKSVPVSLRDLLGDAYKADNPKVPSLEVRFRLARSLSIALYQLQCAGWVHRKISSYNVIFFRDRSTDELNLDHPFLVGWQYSRPDDQRRIFPSEQGNEGIGDLDMYVHRLRLATGGHGRYPRFRKSFDIYSLGIILIEIAFWEPIIALTDEEERKSMESMAKTISSGDRARVWWKSILTTAEDELAPEMGIAYQDAVLFCLLGGETASKVDSSRYSDKNETEVESREDYYYIDRDFEEIGIEKEFYWKVLKPLERFGM
ncbi:prion-inhibition and propagation-domain-containing protein [Rhexocercosporidium sp. MPI-PUGE-AT-0058]|nr:prion-inhibition and propagation-domain-containing protein [Rhexocercosporidium sp. MPI-PUGE-AT-0058]